MEMRCFNLVIRCSVKSVFFFFQLEKGTFSLNDGGL